MEDFGTAHKTADMLSIAFRPRFYRLKRLLTCLQRNNSVLHLLHQGCLPHLPPKKGSPAFFYIDAPSEIFHLGIFLTVFKPVTGGFSGDIA